MNNWQKMKEIAVYRAEGPWINNHQEIRTSCPDLDRGVAFTANISDAEFIVMVANNWSKIEAVIEAAMAKPIVEHWSDEYCNANQGDVLESAVATLKNAIDALERE